MLAAGGAGKAGGLPPAVPGRLRQRRRRRPGLGARGGPRAGAPGGPQLPGPARASEPAAALGLVLAAASSYLDRPVRGDLVVIGEVGLAGEVRAVTGLEARLKEAAAPGFG